MFFYVFNAAFQSQHFTSDFNLSFLHYFCMKSLYLQHLKYCMKKHYKYTFKTCIDFWKGAKYVLKLIMFLFAVCLLISTSTMYTTNYNCQFPYHLFINIALHVLNYHVKCLLNNIKQTTYYHFWKWSNVNFKSIWFSQFLATPCNSRSFYTKS